MFYEKKLRVAFFKSAALSLLFLSALSGCDFFNSFSNDYSAVSHFALDANVLSISVGNFESVAINCKPEEEQAKLQISWSYDENIIELVPDNFSVVVYGKNPGTTTLKASISNFSSSCIISVTGPAAPTVSVPYVYSNISFISLTADSGPSRVIASLAGGTPNDVSGFSFEAEHSGIVSIQTEGNAAWLKALSNGITRVTIRHQKSSFPYSFIASCNAESLAIPYISTDSNVISINKSISPESSFSVNMINSNSFIYDSDYSFSILDSDYNPISNPPVSITANGKNCIISPLSSGECFIRVSHASPEVTFPLDVLVIVYEQIENVFIELPEPILYVYGDSAATFSVSLSSLPPGVSADPSDFSWEFPDNVSDFADFNIFGGSSSGTGNSLWLSAKKSGSFPVSVSHPLAELRRTFYVVVKNINNEALDTSVYISTSQNYVLTAANSAPVSIAVTLHNLNPGDERDLLWSVEHNPSDNSNNPVIEYVSATGSYSSARSIAPVSSGSLTINPVRQGSAAVSISHPKAFYNTTILVSVLPQDSPIIEKPFLLSADNSFITLINGESANISVSLEGGSVLAADEDLILWSSSGPALSISPFKTHAVISAAGSGFSKNTVTVTHPNAQSPLILTIVCGDDLNQIYSAKYVTAGNYNFIIEQNQEIIIHASINNQLDTDSLAWNVPSGLNSVVSIAQVSPFAISVTGLAPGIANIAASIANDPNPNTAAAFQIIVSSPSAPPAVAAYLSTSDNVVILDPFQEKTASITPINIPNDGLVSWAGFDTSLIDLIPNNLSAVIRAKENSGSTSVTVSHPKSANSLTINVRVGNRFIYENSNVSFISTPSDTVILKSNDSPFQFQAILANTELPDTSAAGFSFAISNPAAASIEHMGNSNSVFIKPVAPGQAILTVSHPQAPNKEILVIIEHPDGGYSSYPYITSKHNIVTLIAGDTALISSSLVNAASYNNSEWKYSSSNNPAVSIVANNGPTAILRGYNPGQAVISIEHDKAPHPLTITVVCIDPSAAAAQPWIKTSHSIVTLNVNSSEIITAEMIGGSGSDNNSFRFTSSNNTAVLLNPSSNTAYIRGAAPGTAIITVANTLYPADSPGNRKTVLVIVEPSVSDDVFISFDKNFVQLDPHSAASEVITASINGPNTSNADLYSFAFWADDYSVIHLNIVNNSLSVSPTGKTGITTIHAKHPKAAYTADIIVMISKYSQFAFSETSKSIPKNGVAFISMNVPPQSGNAKIEYASNNPAVCEIIGSLSTAMIAGIAHGQTSVSASLIVDNVAVATSELAVIVDYVPPNGNAITIGSSIVNMEIGQQLPLKAALQGPDISDQDKYNIVWESKDPDIASLFSTDRELNLAKGPETLLTALKAGETFIRVSHDKVRYEPSALHPQPDAVIEYILVIIPEQFDKLIKLDQSFVTMLKDDPDIKITADIVNGSPSDYSSITWSAPRISGQNIISIRGNGKECNVHPLNVGTTTLRAQLPGGDHFDCIISVQASASISISKNALHLNPGYSETISYSVSPENALIQWHSFPPGLEPDKLFTYDVNTAAKTITVNALDIGSGYIQAFMLSGGSAGNNFTSRLNVFIEYNYSFELESNVINAQPFPGTFINIPYRVFPADLQVSCESVSHPDAVAFINNSHDSANGTGSLRFEALAEQDDVLIKMSAKNPNDPNMAPIQKQVSLRLIYDDVFITPRFYQHSGSFSNFKQDTAAGTWELFLGDGEDVLFYLETDKPNADIRNLRVINYEPYDGERSVHNTLDSDSNPKSNEKETGYTNDLGFIRAGWDEESFTAEGIPLFRISHKKDFVNSDYFLITKDMSFRDLKSQNITTVAGAGPNGSYSSTTLHDTHTYPSVIFTKNAADEPGLPPEHYGLVYDSFLSKSTIRQSNIVFFNTVLTGTSLIMSFNDPEYSEDAYDPGLGDGDIEPVDLGPSILYRSDYRCFEEIIEDSWEEGPNERQVINSYKVSGSQSSGSSATANITRYSFTIFYEDCAPYAIDPARFTQNKNYFFQSKDPDFNDGEPVILHHHASKTTSKNTNPVQTHKGVLTATYTRLGENVNFYIHVTIQVRDCEFFLDTDSHWVYQNGKYFLNNSP